MQRGVVYPTKESIYKAMADSNVKEVELFVTAYVNLANQQDWGWSFENRNSDYYFRQGEIEEKTEKFKL